MAEGVDAIKRDAIQAIGSADAMNAQANAKAGNYGDATVYGLSAVGNAAFTVLGGAGLKLVGIKAVGLVGAMLGRGAKVEALTADTIAGRASESLAGRQLADAAGEAPAATFGTSSTKNYRTTFLKANPQLEGEVVVHHAVEQQVLTRYPELVSLSEMHSLENLRGIPKEINADLHLRKIRGIWDDFYIDFPNPSKQQLLNKATEIDNLFGNKFNPPVR